MIYITPVLSLGAGFEIVKKKVELFSIIILIAQERLITVFLSPPKQEKFHSCWKWSEIAQYIQHQYQMYCCLGVVCLMVGRFLTITSLSVSGISSSTLTGIWAHGIYTICIHVTVMGVGSALVQVCNNRIERKRKKVVK